MSDILFLTQVLPYPLNSGAKIRAYYVLRHLAQKHDVTLVSFVREDDRAEDVAHLRTFCREVHTVRMRRSRLRDARALAKSILTGRPAVIARDEIREMHRTLRHLLAERTFDVVHADQTSMAQYALYVRTACPEFREGSKRSNPTLRSGQAVRTCLDAHNALYRVPERLATHEANPARRWLYAREARALQRYEAEAYRQFDHVVFVTDVDRRELFATRNPQPTTRNSQPTTSVIPICVDPAYKPLVERKPRPLAVTHLGTMFWPPNVEGVLWFAREVFPRVLAEVPEARFVVVGKDPPQEVRDLAFQVRRVQVTGYVPDPEPYLAETGVFIVPLRAGGGMRVKIVDAWAWGVPIVSTTIGAEGIAVEDGRDILIADEPTEMAEAVIRVLRDPALGRRLRANGRNCVEARYNWRRVYTAWDEVYAKLLRPNLSLFDFT